MKKTQDEELDVSQQLSQSPLLILEARYPIIVPIIKAATTRIAQK